MNFIKKVLLLSQCFFLSCDHYRTICKCENVIVEQWNRNSVIKNKMTIDKDYNNVGLLIDIHYDDDVQYQNIFLCVKLIDGDGNIMFEKKDLMFMLFDSTSGVPLGRKVFRKQHLEFLITDELKLKKGTYQLEIKQMTRAENLCGIKKIISSFNVLKN